MDSVEKNDMISRPMSNNSGKKRIGSGVDCKSSAYFKKMSQLCHRIKAARKRRPTKFFRVFRLRDVIVAPFRHIWPRIYGQSRTSNVGALDLDGAE